MFGEIQRYRGHFEAKYGKFLSYKKCTPKGNFVDCLMLNDIKYWNVDVGSARGNCEKHVEKHLFFVYQAWCSEDSDVWVGP